MSRITTSPFTMTTQVGWWDISFSLLGTTPSVRASNLLTNEELSMPEDFKKLSDLMDVSMWPEFARPKLNKDNQHLADRLF